MMAQPLDRVSVVCCSLVQNIGSYQHKVTKKPVSLCVACGLFIVPQDVAHRLQCTPLVVTCGSGLEMLQKNIERVARARPFANGDEGTSRSIRHRARDRANPIDIVSEV